MAHATIQMLTNLVSNESLKPQGYRFEPIFSKFLNVWSKSLSKDGKVHFLNIHCFLTKDIEQPNTKKCQQTMEF